MKYPALAIAFVVGVANVSWGAPPTEPEPNRIAFYAYDWNKEGHIYGRAGVLCAILRQDAVDEIGKTDSNGQISVPNEQLFRPGNIAIMFCPDSLESQCTSIRLNTSYLHGFVEYNVRVPVPEIIDRMKTTVPAKPSRG